MHEPLIFRRNVSRGSMGGEREINGTSYMFFLSSKFGVFLLFLFQEVGWQKDCVEHCSPGEACSAAAPGSSRRAQSAGDVREGPEADHRVLPSRELTRADVTRASWELAPLRHKEAPPSSPPPAPRLHVPPASCSSSLLVPQSPSCTPNSSSPPRLHCTALLPPLPQEPLIFSLHALPLLSLAPRPLLPSLAPADRLIPTRSYIRLTLPRKVHTCTLHSSWVPLGELGSGLDAHPCRATIAHCRLVG